MTDVRKILAVISCIVLAGAAFAQGGPAGGSKPGGGGSDKGSGSGMAGFEDGGGRASIDDVKGLASRLRLGETEMTKLQTMLKTHNEELARLRADLEVVRAKLTRLLVEKDPDLETIRKTIRESVEIEYRIRVMQVERNVQMRKIVGEDNWAIMLRISTRVMQLSRKGMSNAEIEAVFRDDPATLALVRLALGLSW